jgi:hypothetical protein
VGLYAVVGRGDAGHRHLPPAITERAREPAGALGTLPRGQAAAAPLADHVHR